MADKDTKQEKQRPLTDKPQSEGAGAAPPMPKGSRRAGIPSEGPLPHGQEPARPRDTGRQGA